MIIIGEKINATKKGVSNAIAERDEAFIAALAISQAEAGAHVIDVNAGTGRGDTKQAAEDMAWLIGVVEKAVSLPVAVDTETPEVLEAALSAVTGPFAWINSVSAEKTRLEKVLPLAKKYGCPVIALCMGDDGIPKNAEGRMKAARIIYERAISLRIEPERLYFDPLVMPIGAEQDAGAMALECIRLIKAELSGANTVCGLSNVSFGLPMRPLVNRAFLVLCAGAGLDAAILDPLDDTLLMELYAALALLGKDRRCMNFIRAFRKRSKKGGKP